jgi:hypothetical protein
MTGESVVIDNQINGTDDNTVDRPSTAETVRRAAVEN